MGGRDACMAHAGLGFEAAWACATGGCSECCQEDAGDTVLAPGAKLLACMGPCSCRTGGRGWTVSDGWRSTCTAQSRCGCMKGGGARYGTMLSITMRGREYAKGGGESRAH